MKTMVIALAACMGMLALSARANYREFTDVTGRTITAKLIRYDGTKNKVTLDCKGKGVKTVPVTVFSEADQKYIISWSKSQDFLDERKLKVNIKRFKEFNNDHSMSYSGLERKYYDCHFVIKLENRSLIDFENVNLEYVIYYSQDHHVANWSKREERQGTHHAERQLDLKSKKLKEVRTDDVILYYYKITANSVGRPDLEGEVHGVMVKLSLKTASGETISRLVSYPEGLKESWEPDTTDVQIMPSN